MAIGKVETEKKRLNDANQRRTSAMCGEGMHFIQVKKIIPGELLYKMDILCIKA